MGTMETRCQICGKPIRIVNGKPVPHRSCAGPRQGKAAGGQYFRKGTRVIAFGQKKNDK